ncbi:metallophosphoesterase family protein [Coprothermobacter platensis]|uniref:metallophosphoesterase family protein n=1 Tax=Coprothermobacter platensis TaxID=108819 RepID=UPI0003685B27|nr:metallophosphoesterase family protein [Coprothermobacter platensis]
MKILVVSDVHGNNEALQAVLNKESDADEVVFLGDFVDYGPSPNEVIDTIKKLTGHSLIGNHDYAAVYGVSCQCGLMFYELSVETRLNFTIKVLTEQNKQYLKRLKPMESWTIGGYRFLATHGAPSDPLYKYLRGCDRGSFKGEAEAAKRANPGSLVNLFPNGNENNYDFILVGHSHEQFLVCESGLMFLNPGSVGQPRDYIPMASYALIEDGVVSLKRVKYDTTATCKEIDKMPIKEQSKEKLKTVIMMGAPNWDLKQEHS